MSWRCWKTCLLIAGWLSWHGPLARADSLIPRIDRRFSVDNVQEVPNFRQHVIPLMSKVGCSNRACHGSFQGQGGFRLSLFGYDFKADHEAMLQGEHPRVVPGQPQESLVLLKPSLKVEHEGGEVLPVGSWGWRVIAHWIAAGAPPVDASTPEFERLEIEPRELLARQAGDRWQLQVIAVWSNGQREDVTPLCRFSSNDDQVATITDEGLVEAKHPGDTHVVVFYDNGVVPVPVLFPVSDRTGSDYPAVPTPTRIDELVVAKLRKLGIIPAEVCTDAEFLRRVSLDITGTLPTAEETEAFLNDSSPDKRARKIDELLERPGYAAWWATRFCDWSGNNQRFLNNNNPGGRGLMARQWYDWMQQQLARNTPYHKIVEGMVLARSRLDGESYAEFSARMSRYLDSDSGQSFADQPYLPHYWARTNFNSADDRALGFAYTFLGLRIQCAQCHKHPFDQWTKDDFDRFKRFFEGIRYGVRNEDRKTMQTMLEELGFDLKKRNVNQLTGEMQKLAEQGKVVPFQELLVSVYNNRPRNARNRNQTLTGRTAKVLGGEEVRLDTLDDPREALMDWMLDEHNPYFARAIVNRVWANYFHRGIVEPTDDLSLANPPCNEALLDYLAEAFREHGYDLKWLHREICNSQTYQRSWRSNETNRHDERNFSRAVPRRLPAEVAYDALRIATASDLEAARWQTQMRGRAIANPIVTTQGNRNDYALTVFGRSVRMSNCDCDRSSEASLLQTVFLQNDQETLDMIDRRGGWVDQVVKTYGGSRELQRGAAANPTRDQARALEKLRERLRQARQQGDQELARKLRQEMQRLQQQLDDRVPETAHAGVTTTASASTAITEIITRTYLRTVNRYPTPAEQQRAAAYFEETRDLTIATRDLLWALINTKEFVLNH
ncbi:MAG: hypothetical protein KatS3mg114_1072 [Planctomycetaceae bacterium]|nr:MAG: hypothetical protein KatS3mg114_1072 [Planctomycetaceae bacterium]